ncbi:uncharacterized protein LOC141692116 [Apium graveolens]|uniref:uncharacterized protein LOC141692116 n=1 Tax=Apium graveolens TaxID=4045 RepID=UPI003D797BC6
MVTVETQGHSGGIAMLWRYKEEAILNSFSKNHIDMRIKNKSGNEYRLTGVYGEPDRSKRQETWSMMRTLAMNNSLPWCLIGDFNNVTSQNDKAGGIPYPQRLIQGFREVLNDCNLVDMELRGYPYTWERGAGTSEWIEVRLDRAIVNIPFLDVFTDATLTNLEISTSDHCPILLGLQKIIKDVHIKNFRFENAWLREPMCHQIVEEVWAGNTNKTLFEKLEKCVQVFYQPGARKLPEALRREFIIAREF